LLRSKSTLFVFVLLLFAACNKDSISLNYTELSTGIDTKLRGIYFFNNATGFVCGGEKNQSGVILKTIDGGINWQQVYSSSLAMRDITFVNDSLGFACGDSLLIVKTTDGGNTWNKLDLPYVPIIICPLTSIQFLDAQHGYICGGENTDKGITLRTADGGVWWDYQAFYNREITENYFTNDTTGYITANGAVFKATADVLTNNYLNIDGDFFTSVYFITSYQGFVCGYDGGIYKTTDGGASWKQVRKDNSAFSARTHFNKIRFRNEHSGLAVGNNGAVFYTNDTGETWQQSDNFPDEHLYSIFRLNSSTCFISGESGKLYKVSF
jgi:photosystem II stability/assembly factor-like uncharacterized protein